MTLSPSHADWIDDTSSVIELRQYTLHPGQRDVLIDVFDREFIETQEAVGMRVLGQFRDLDRADRFAWLRGYRDMTSREAGLKAFYGGPVWKQHRAVAVATMIDSDDVLLLRPIGARSGFSLPKERAIAEASHVSSVVQATICLLSSPVDDEFTMLFEERVKPVLSEAGARPLAYFETEPAENTFPALPVRTGEHAFVWFSSFSSAEQCAAHRKKLAELEVWKRDIMPELSKRLASDPQLLRLEPTSRSLLRHRWTND